MQSVSLSLPPLTRRAARVERKAEDSRRSVEGHEGEIYLSQFKWSRPDDPAPAMLSGRGRGTIGQTDTTASPVHSPRAGLTL
jgi:hypothetical protein